MRNPISRFGTFAALLALILCAPARPARGAEPKPEPNKPHRYLYVAEPGVRDYTEFGGHGLLVFDIDGGHKFVRRIPTAGLEANGKPSNVKGVVASAVTKRLYITTLKKLQCIDLTTDRLLWEKAPAGGCDRLAISPDGKTLFTPSLEGAFWNIIDAATGDVTDKVVTNSGAHNTICGLDGKAAYFAGLKSPVLNVVDTQTHRIVSQVGPFANVIRPFTVNGRQTLTYVTVNDLLGFEIGDLKTGKVLHRVEVQGFKKGAVKRHGCPSHGIGLTPDETEVWVCDAHNQQVHVFDNTVMPPKQIKSIPVREEPGWVTFTIDGQYAYPSTSEVIDVKTKQTVAKLTDEQGRPVMSEKMLEIDFDGTNPVRTGDQFGLGRVTTSGGAVREARAGE